MARHNRASFTREDRADAKRGRPDFELRGYAGERGLEFLDHGTPAGYRAALPGDPEWQHSVLRGRLAGGAFGVVAHEGLPVPADGAEISWSGKFHSYRISTRGRVRPWQVAISLLPVVGWLVPSGETPPVHVPCTTAAVRVPETAAPLTHMRIDRRRNAPPYNFGEAERLDDLGLPGWFLRADPAPSPATLEALLAPPVDRLLADHAPDGLFQIVVWFGTLLVRRNGYLRDPAQLDELARAASLLAARLRDVCLPLAEPRRFDAAVLPEPGWIGQGAVRHPFYPRDAWRRWAVETAAARRLTLEDPLAYHRAFPGVPVPGAAYVVMRGDLPGIGRGRLAVHREREHVRPAVLEAAAQDAEPTPPEGERFPDRGVVREVRDGIRAVWSTTSFWGDAMAGDLEDFLSRAASVA